MSDAQNSGLIAAYSRALTQTASIADEANSILDEALASGKDLRGAILKVQMLLSDLSALRAMVAEVELTQQGDLNG